MSSQKSTEENAAPKRKRRTKKEIERLLQSVLNCLGEYNGDRITIRHLFYRLANDYKSIEKTEKAYNSLRSLLVKWRRSGEVPVSAFIDGTRWHYGSEGYADAMTGMMDLAATQYRLNIWQSTDRYVELWAEKDAIVSIIHPIASEWNLKTFPTRGDVSISSLHDASQTFNAARKDGRKPTIIYLGDYDEVGLDIPKVIKRNLLQDHGSSVELIRAAVTREQIDEWKLPTRPPKNVKRGLAIDVAVEVDVLPPSRIRELVRGIIEEMVDPLVIDRMKRIEKAEREAVSEILWQPNAQSKLAKAWEEQA